MLQANQPPCLLLMAHTKEQMNQKHIQDKQKACISRWLCGLLPLQHIQALIVSYPPHLLTSWCFLLHHSSSISSPVETIVPTELLQATVLI